MFFVVSYEIKDDNRRNKVCNELKNFGNHVQYSVFECDLNKAQIKNLQGRLGNFIKKSEDSIRYYFLCRSCLARVRIQGKTTFL